MDNSIRSSKFPEIEVDLTDVEHIGALLTGGLLLATGLKRGGRFGALLGLTGGALIYRGQSGYRRLYNMLGLTLPETASGPGRRGIHVEASVDIKRSKADLYRIWRHLENLPIFMKHLRSVVEVNDVHSRWVANGPLGTVIKWDAKIVNDIEDEIIAWVSLEGSGIDSAGSVHFEEINKGATRVRVKMSYQPPADRLGVALSKLLGSDPQAQIERELQDFKTILELATPNNKVKATVA